MKRNEILRDTAAKGKKEEKKRKKVRKIKQTDEIGEM